MLIPSNVLYWLPSAAAAAGASSSFFLS